MFMGFVFLYIDLYVRMKKRSVPTEKIVYREIPLSPTDQLNEQVFPSDIFATMFTQPSPWISSVNDLDTRQRDNINKYFVSQI